MNDFRVEDFLEYRRRQDEIQPLKDRVDTETQWQQRLEAIRGYYGAMTDEEKCAADPYASTLFNWLTPIERLLWDDIRTCGWSPVLMQLPVGPYFVDFGDPRHKIAIEADGKEFHNKDLDRVRDQRIYDETGWKVFRVTGAECKRVVVPPWDREDGAPPELFYGRTSEGVVRAIRAVYVDKDVPLKYAAAMYDSLASHKLANFETPEIW